ncbi:MAG: TRAP transporter small permease subunit [Alphaproteobacteria bacterium]|nr:TRAP transporter small permease subunit [Alphaproteobacteria bacterium]
MAEHAQELTRYTDADRPVALSVSDRLRNFVDGFGKAASWLIVPLVIITCFDVIIRKLTWRAEDGSIVFGLQYYLVTNVSEWFGSTLLQEMEWHLHTGLFALVLAYGYIYNTHVRVDLVRETLAFRKKAWIEFLGITIFLIPFVAITTYFAFDYAHTSFQTGEISASTVGLTNRWIIKSVLVVGLLLVLCAGLAVWLQTYMVLFGDPSRRYDLMTLEWPEEEGTMIEGKKRIELDETPDVAPTVGTGAREPT